MFPQCFPVYHTGNIVSTVSFSKMEICLCYTAGNHVLAKIRACEQLQKFCEHEQGSTRRVIFRAIWANAKFCDLFECRECREHLCYEMCFKNLSKAVKSRFLLHPMPFCLRYSSQTSNSESYVTCIYFILKFLDNSLNYLKIKSIHSLVSARRGKKKETTTVFLINWTHGEGAPQSFTFSRSFARLYGYDSGPCKPDQYNMLRRRFCCITRTIIFFCSRTRLWIDFAQWR